MPTLGEILGGLMADVTHARRIADEHAVRLAEYYASEPLLQGLPVPRLRLPEVVVDLPVLLDDYLEGAPAETRSEDDLRDLLTQVVADVLGQEHSEPQSIIHAFHERLRIRLLPRGKVLPGFEGVSIRTNLAEAAQLAMRDAAEECEFDLPSETMARLAEAFKVVADEEAVLVPAKPPSLELEVKTGEVKGRSNSGSISRLRVVLQEEGLEWHHQENSDGTRSSGLTLQ